MSWARDGSVARAVAVCAGLWFVSLLFRVAPAQAQIPEVSAESVRATLEGLHLATSQMKNGDGAAAADTLARLRDSVAQQSLAAERVQAVGAAAFDQCNKAVQHYVETLGALAAKEKAAERARRDLQAEIAAIDARITQQQAEQLLVAIDRVLAEKDKAKRRAALSAVSRALSELGALPKGFPKGAPPPRRTDWKVLVESLFGISRSEPDVTRELVLLRDFLGQRASAAAGLRKKQLQAHGQFAAANAYLILQDRVMQELKHAKEEAVFLSNAKNFWRRVEGIYAIKAEFRVRELQVLQSTLQGEAGVEHFSSEWARSADSFESTLLAVQRLLDDNRFAIAAGRGCSGPDLVEQHIEAIGRCNIVPTYPYYRIVDPSKCTYQHANPPGCPPQVRVPPRLSGYGREKNESAWKTSRRADNQNWIGAGRCVSDRVHYYGQVRSLDACEQICRSDASCSFWSFNRGNGTIPRSEGECWGGDALQPRETREWLGFVSGGLESR